MHFETPQMNLDRVVNCLVISKASRFFLFLATVLVKFSHLEECDKAKEIEIRDEKKGNLMTLMTVMTHEFMSLLRPQRPGVSTGHD